MFRFFFGDTRDPFSTGPFSRDDMYGENGYEDNGIDSIFQYFHSDMQQHLEEIQQQMEDMAKSFGTVEFSNIPRVEFPDSPSRNSNLRDEMLKTPETPPLRPQIPSQPPAVNTPNSGQQDKSFFGGFGLPRLSPFSSHTNEPKVDQDLDGRGADVLKDLESSRCKKCPSQKDMPLTSFFSGQSVTVRSVQGLDGKMEQWRTVQDSSGNKEETCTRYIDGKMHTVTRKIDDKGNEERIEEFKNMDESDLSSFNKTWDKPSIDAVQPEHPADSMMMPQTRQDSYLGSLFSKLFGFKP